MGGKGEAITILMAAGEVSGDMQGGFLARALLAKEKNLSLYGTGGPKMRAAGVDLRIETTQFSSVGLFEALPFIAPLRRVMKDLEKMIQHDRPQAAILIDNHGFNLALARFLKKEGIPVIYYFPPQAWVGSFLIAGGVARNTNLIISAFEKEAEIYRRHGGRAVSFGHPLIDIAKPGADPSAALAGAGIEPGRPCMALLPGSRRQEVEMLARPMLGAAILIKKRIPGMQFLLPVASRHLRPLLEKTALEAGCREAIHFVDQNIYACLSQCRLSLTTTGTSTLEAALLGVPMVAAYVLHPLSYRLGRMLASTRYLAMPNLLLEDFVVPEILQREVRAERLAEAALQILESPARQDAIRERFREIPAILGGEGALNRAAEFILKELVRYPAGPRAIFP